MSGICAGIDLGIGLAFISIMKAHAYIAATIGWSGGLTSGFILHSHWTFLERKESITSKTVGFYIANCLLILLVRWIVIALAEEFIHRTELILILAVNVSFSVNYFISRNFIFR